MARINSSGGGGYKAPAYKAPVYKAPALNKKQRDDEAFYTPPSPVVPAWLPQGNAESRSREAAPLSGPQQGQGFVELQRQNALRDAFNLPVQRTNIPGTTVPLGSDFQMKPVAAPSAQVFNPRTGQRGDAPTWAMPSLDFGGQADQGEVFNPRTGQRGTALDLMDIIDLFKPQPGLPNAGIRGPRGELLQEPDLGWWSNLFNPQPDRRTVSAPRENVGSLPRPFVREHVTPQMARGPQRYVSPLPETDYVDPFGTTYGGNWRGGGGGGGYDGYGGGGDYPQWLKDMYDNLYSWNYRG